MPTSTLLLVEGPHDLEFCARLLKPKGFSRVQDFAALVRDHPFWRPAVPERWPVGGDLLARHPVPLFLANPEGDSVAVVNAAGISKLTSRLGYTLGVLDFLPDAIGFILDADNASTPRQRCDVLLAQIVGLVDPVARSLRWAPVPGEVYTGAPRTGIFVMPDSRSQGTLEDLLLEAGASAYPQLLDKARRFVSDAVQDPTLQADDLEELRKPAGLPKSTAAAMASILRPGKSIQVSIQVDRWLEPASLNLPRIAALQEFLEALVGS
jgi:hypothetical protein